MDSSTIDSQWNFSDPAASEEAFRSFLEQTDDPAARRQITTQIARALGLQRKFDEAHQLLDEIDGVSTDEPLTLVRCDLERGRLFNSAGKQEAARPLFERAFERAINAELEFYAVDAAHMLGIANPPDEQLKWSLEALRLAEAAQSERARGWLGSLYNNIGWSLHELGRHDEALDLFERGLAFRRESGKEPGLRIARWTVARQLRELGRVEAAHAEQRAILEDYGDEVSGYVYEELGECLLALDREDEARAHFARAHQELSQDPWLVANEPDRLERLKRLGS